MILRRISTRLRQLLGVTAGKTTIAVVVAVICLCQTRGAALTLEKIQDPEVIGKSVNGAVDSIEVKILFPISKSYIDTGFKDNASRLQQLLRRLKSIEGDSCRLVGKIRVNGNASPDGNHRFNQQLAQRRAESLATYLRNQAMLPDSLIEVAQVGIDWNGLCKEMSQSGHPDAERVVRIIRDEPEFTYSGGKLVKSRKQHLMNLKGGRTWNWMMQNIYPELRNSASVICYVQQIPDIQPEPLDTVIPPYLEIEEIAEETGQQTDTIAEPQEPLIQEKACKDFYMSLYTNMVSDLAALPNLGVEFYLGKRFSVAANWTYGWWSEKSRNRFWRGYGGYVSGRYWFGKKASEKPLTGHHAGLYGAMLIYDFEWGGRGYLGGAPGHNIFDHPSYSFGVEYGYSLPVASRLNIDFTLGLGYMGGRYYQYVPIDGHYVWQSTHERHWWGPTRLEVNLVWLLGHGNVNKRKGGDR